MHFRHDREHHGYNLLPAQTLLGDRSRSTEMGVHNQRNAQFMDPLQDGNGSMFESHNIGIVSRAIRHVKTSAALQRKATALNTVFEPYPNDPNLHTADWYAFPNGPMMTLPRPS